MNDDIEQNPGYGSAIKGFFDEYRFLSNFWFVTVVYEGKTYRTVEHAYQAAKTDDPYWRRVIREAGSPGKAKGLAKMIHANDFRSDWEEVRVGIMYSLLEQKFTLHKDLREKLLATGNAYLEETNTWNDKFWGVCDGEGENVLGQCLMDIRNDLRVISSTE